MKSPFLKYIIFTICAGLYCYIIWRYVTRIAIEWLGMVEQSSVASVCILALFAITGFLFFYFYSWRKNSLLTSYLVSYVGIFLITLLHAYDSPLESRILPFQIFLPVFLMFYSCRLFQSTSIEKYHVIVFVAVFIILAITIFSNIQTVAFLAVGDEYVTSASYSILFLLPAVLCINNKYIKYACVIIVAIALFLSNKRVGVIAFVFSLAAYLVVYTKQSSFKKRFSFIVALVIAVLLIGPYIYSRIGDSFILSRIENVRDDKGSGRDDVYKQSISLITESDFEGIVVGHGWNSVAKKAGMSAHNDFLEITYDFGWPLAILYLLFVFQLLKYTFRCYKENNKYAGPMVVSIIIFTIHSSFSHILLYPEYMMPFALFWGMVVGDNDRIIHSQINAKPI